MPDNRIPRLPTSVNPVAPGFLCRSDQLSNAGWAKSGLTENQLHESPLHILAVDGHDGAAVRGRMLEDDVAALLTLHDETRPLEGAEQLGTVERWQAGHASRGTRTVTGNANARLSRFSTGNGSPSRTRLVR
jgi:hypothetical protein